MKFSLPDLAAILGTRIIFILLVTIQIVGNGTVIWLLGSKYQRGLSVPNTFIQGYYRTRRKMLKIKKKKVKKHVKIPKKYFFIGKTRIHQKYWVSISVYGIRRILRTSIFSEDCLEIWQFWITGMVLFLERISVSGWYPWIYFITFNFRLYIRYKRNYWHLSTRFGTR